LGNVDKRPIKARLLSYETAMNENDEMLRLPITGFRQGIYNTTDLTLQSRIVIDLLEIDRRIAELDGPTSILCEMIGPHLMQLLSVAAVDDASRVAKTD